MLWQRVCLFVRPFLHHTEVVTVNANSACDVASLSNDLSGRAGLDC